MIPAMQVEKRCLYLNGGLYHDPVRGFSSAQLSLMGSRAERSEGAAFHLLQVKREQNNGVRAVLWSEGNMRQIAFRLCKIIW